MLIDRLIPAELRVSIERQRQDAVVACLEARGFRILPPDFSGISESVGLQYTLERLAYGVPNTYSGSLGIAKWALAKPIAQSIAPAKAYGPAFTLAEMGDFSDPSHKKISFETTGGSISFDAEGCIGQSYLQVFGSEKAIGTYTQLPHELQSDIDARLDSADAVASALLRWSSCSESRGFSFRSPREAVSAVAEAYSGPDLSRAADMESQTLELLKGCESESGLFAEIMSELPSVEDDIVRLNAGLVDELQRIADTAGRTGT